jgi:thiol-disulfide isomerase/thioredoxin
MLNQKYFSLPLWVWLVVIGIVLYSYCQSITDSKSQVNSTSKPKDEKKEKFADITNSKLKIFNFNTDWCGWSKRFQPDWDKFAEAVKDDPELNNKVDVIDVKCDNEENEEMCEAYNVPGFPYVVAEINGRREPYKGERTAQALLSFVSSV